MADSISLLRFWVVDFQIIAQDFFDVPLPEMQNFDPASVSNSIRGVHNCFNDNELHKFQHDLVWQLWSFKSNVNGCHVNSSILRILMSDILLSQFLGNTGLLILE